MSHVLLRAAEAFWNRMLRMSGFLLAAALAVSSPVLAREPYKRMLDDPLEFTGIESLDVDPLSLGEIRIGIFASDRPDDPVGRAISRGATLAVEQANRDGGLQMTGPDGTSRAVPFRLIQRWADDPWGAGSKEVIRLVFSDGVWAIIGGPDGHSTHVAQQITTKALVPLISPVSSDPTLTHTRVPWIFRLPPDDDVQAHALLEEGVLPCNIKRVGLITSTDHDGRTAASSLLKEMESRGVPPVFHFTLTPEHDACREIAERVKSFSPQGVVLRLPRRLTGQLLDALRRAEISCPVFMPWIPGLGLHEIPPIYTGPLVQVEPFAPARACGPYLKFVRAYVRKFGSRPPPVAAYAYDAALLITEGMKKAGPARSKLRDFLAGATGRIAASGIIEWDNGGGNTARPVVRVWEPTSRWCAASEIP